MSDFKVKVDGDFGSLEDQIKSMMERVNKEQERLGGKISKDLANEVKKIKDLTDSRRKEARAAIEENFRSNIGSGMGFRDANRMRIDAIREFQGENALLAPKLDQLNNSLSNVDRGIKEVVREQKLTPQRLAGALVTTLALREMAQAAGAYFDRRAGLSVDTYGTTPGSNVVDAGFAGLSSGIGMAALAGGPVGIIAGIITAALTYAIKDFSQKDERDLMFTDKLFRSSGSLGRYGNYGFDNLLHYNSKAGNNEYNNVLAASLIGIGVSDFYARTESAMLKGGLAKDGNYMRRAFDAAALEKGYGVNVDFGLGKIVNGEATDISLKMLNKLTTIETKSGISANNLILANQKLGEFGAVVRQQLSYRFTPNVNQAMLETMAFQRLMPNANAEGIARAASLFKQDVAGYGGLSDIIANTAAFQTLQEGGNVNFADIAGQIERQKRFPTFRSQQIFAQNLKKFLPMGMPNRTFFLDKILQASSSIEGLNDDIYNKGIFGGGTANEFNVDRALFRTKTMVNPADQAQAGSEYQNAESKIQEYLDKIQENFQTLSVMIKGISSTVKNGKLQVQVVR